jgi:hypothetical protein
MRSADLPEPAATPQQSSYTVRVAAVRRIRYAILHIMGIRQANSRCPWFTASR